MVDITAGAGAVPQREFRIGKVISKAFSVFGAHFATFSLIAATVWFPVILFAFFYRAGDQTTQAIQSVVTLASSFFLQPLSTAIILYGAFQHMRGQPVRLGDCISRGLARFIPLIGLMLLMALGIMLGALLFIIPAFILLVMWYVAVPVSVVERTGPVASLRRSRALTKGHRWKIFGMYLLLLIVSGGIGSLLPIGGAAIGGTVGALAAQWIWQGVAGAFGSVLAVVAYHDLRVAKEGVDIERIAEVFD